MSVVAMASHTLFISDARSTSWNAQLYSAVSVNISAVSIHPYLHLDDDSRGGGPLQPGVPPRTSGEGPTGWSENATVQQLFIDEVLRSDSGMELLLGVPFWLATTALGNAATHARLPARLRMIVTEYNVMERAGPVKLSWAHALFVSAAAYTLLALDQVDAVLLHVLLNGFGWGALYETTSDFTPGGTPPAGSAATAVGVAGGCLVPACAHLQTAPYLPSAVGVALGVLSAAMSGASRAVQLDLSHAANRSGALPGGLPGRAPYPSLVGFRFDGGGDADDRAAAGSAHSAVAAVVIYSVLNLAPFEQSFKPDADAPCSTYTTWTSPNSSSIAAWVTISAPVRSAVHQCGGQGSAVALAPYSITVVRASA